MALIHHTNPVIVNDSPKSMRNTQQSLPLESRLHRSLNLHVRLHIQRRRRLIADNDLRIPYQSTGECHELALSEREIRAFFFDDVVEVDVAGFTGGDCDVVFRDEGGLAERGPEF